MQKPSISYPKRGEIFIVDLDPGFGREIRKKRPVLVISNNSLNRILPTVITIPFSSIIPQFIGQDVAVIEVGEGLDKRSAIIVNQIRSVDKERLVKRIGRLSGKHLKQVEEALQITLGLVEVSSGYG